MKEGKAYQYAKWCLEEGEGKVPLYVKKQAESWMEIIRMPMWMKGNAKKSASC